MMSFSEPELEPELEPEPLSSQAAPWSWSRTNIKRLRGAAVLEQGRFLLIVAKQFDKLNIKQKDIDT